MKHPGRTAAHRRILNAIGCGEKCPRMASATRDKMLELGLIVECEPRILGHDRFGAITIPQFEMPAPIHMQWCQAMSAEVEGGKA